MIDDHLMPSGDSPHPPNRRERNLESLAGTSRVELGLGGVVRVLRRRGLWFLAIFVISAGLIYVGSSRLPASYSSLAWVRVTDQTQSLFIKSGQSVDLTKEQRAVIQTLQSPRLNAALRAKLGKAFDGLSAVSATGLEASPLIRIDSEASTARIAERAANAAANFVVLDRRAKSRDRILQRAAVEEKSAATLETTVNDLSLSIASIPTTSPRYSALRAKLDAATAALGAATAAAANDKTNAGSTDGGLEIYEEAIRPIEPTFPQPLSWAILGGTAILLLAMGLVYGREELAGRFHSGDSSESRRAGVRVLGILPKPDGRLPRGVVTGAGSTADEVGLQLVHLLGRGKPHVVLLCGIDGAAPEETARQVAQAIAESGARVVYSACRGVSDPTKSDEFDAPITRTRLSVVQEQQTGGRLRVLDDGIAVVDLTVARARTILRRLTEQCEFVMIAAPSPTIDPSTLVLAELADATVMFAQHGVTTLRDAERAATRLRRVGGAVLGVVVDPAKPGPSGAAYFSRVAGVSAG